jgi:hypothetical protein
VRPERFELPTFWFVAVAPQEANNLDGVLRLMMECHRCFVLHSFPAMAQHSVVLGKVWWWAQNWAQFRSPFSRLPQPHAPSPGPFCAATGLRAPALACVVPRKFPGVGVLWWGKGWPDTSLGVSETCVDNDAWCHGVG